MDSEVSSWKRQLETLASVAQTQPHAAYAAFTHGLIGKSTFLTRTTEDAAQSLQPLEDTICDKLLPKLTGQAPPEKETRELLALPPCLGGLGLIDPHEALEDEFERSVSTSAPLCKLIKDQWHTIGDACHEVTRNRSTTAARRKQGIARNAATLQEKLPENLQRAMEIFSEKGSSHWLNALPLTAHGFSLPKGQFRDALCLRYNWHPQHLPAHCSCGQTFTIDHALTCPNGGFSILRHNEVRDLTAGLL